MDLGLKSKRVLITGSTQGIGKAIAECMLEEGARVLLNGRNQNKLNSLVCELREKYTEEAVLGFKGDITVKEEREKLSQFISEKWGTIDILIPCVGRGKPFSKNNLDEEEWNNLFQINLNSVVQTVNSLKNNVEDGGNIVTISSIASKEVIGAPVAYASAKEGIVVFTKYLSKELAVRHIRVNCVMPGNIFFPGGRWEEIQQDDYEGTRKYIESVVPMKRFGYPKEVAESVAFLASERSSFTTGSVLVIDGGQTNAIR